MILAAIKALHATGKAMALRHRHLRERRAWISATITNRINKELEELERATE